MASGSSSTLTTPAMTMMDMETPRMSDSLTNNAGIDKEKGEVVTSSKEVDSNGTFEVVLNEDEDPQKGLVTSLRRWLAVFVISSSALCVACCSSVAAFTEIPIAQEFRVSTTVSILPISLFVFGLGFGPLLLAPLSEVYGRNIMYRVSFALLTAFFFGVTFAPNIAVLLVFRFLTGFCGSAFLSVAGGSISDFFDNAHVAMPMAIYTLTPFGGPIVGPLVAGFINQHLYWRWTYRIMNIWVFVQFVALVLVVPETYVPVLRKWKAERLRKSTGDGRYLAPLDRRDQSLMSAILFSCYTPFKLLLFDRMVLLLDAWNSLLLGILYLAFQAFPVIFEKGHGFNLQSSGMSFLGIGLGMLIALPMQLYLDRRFKRISAQYNGHPPAETRLHAGKIGAVLVPLSLFWLAFTTYPSVPWPVPIIASIPFGLGVILAFISTFTYLVTAYRPIAASAMASNSAMRSTFAAVFPLFASAMYERLGTVGATALLAGLSTVMAPLPFIFDRIGARLRSKSSFAVSD